MNLLVSFRELLLLLLIICAVAVNLTKNLLRAVIIFMSYSSIMCIVWILLESPDLAITEAAVGAGISGVLFLMTLKRIRAEDAGEAADEEEGIYYDNARDREIQEQLDKAYGSEIEETERRQGDGSDALEEN